MDSFENKIFVLEKELNKIDYRIEEIERDHSIRYPNSKVIINFELFKLREKKKNVIEELLETKKVQRNSLRNKEGFKKRIEIIEDIIENTDKYYYSQEDYYELLGELNVLKWILGLTDSTVTDEVLKDFEKKLLSETHKNGVWENDKDIDNLFCNSYVSDFIGLYYWLVQWWQGIWIVNEESNIANNGVGDNIFYVLNNKNMGKRNKECYNIYGNTQNNADKRILFHYLNFFRVCNISKNERNKGKTL